MAPHAIVDFAAGLLASHNDEKLRLTPPAAVRLRDALLALKGQPDFTQALGDLARLAWLLDTRGAKAAARLMMETAEKVVQPPKRTRP